MKKSNDFAKKKLGELLLEDNSITTEQLTNALRVQKQSGGRIGSKLVELGYLEVDKLVKFLSIQLNHPTINLLTTPLQKEPLSLLSLEHIKKYRAIPISLDEEKRVILAIASPIEASIFPELSNLLGTQVSPVIVPAYQLSLVLREIRGRENVIPNEGILLFDPYSSVHNKSNISITEYPRIWSLCISLSRSTASDLLLVAGVPPSLKKNNEIVRLNAPILSPEQVEIYARELMNKSQLELFKEAGDIDFALTDSSLGRFRINIYNQRNTISIAIRHIIDDIPALKELNLPEWLETYALKSQGLILVSGPNGHGKSTTLASMIDIINKKLKKNIITIEDPIEYLHQHKNCNVNQREIGIDTDSFHSGLKRIYREAPDVILIGEMRDRESIAIALEAAETGHLVLSSLHSNNSTLTINRIVDVFPAEHQQQIRLQLADSLLLIFNQRLVKTRDNKHRVPAYEKLTNSYRVANLIREGKAHQIRTQMVGSDEFSSLDSSLATLVKKKKIDRNLAFHYCQDQKGLADMLRMRD